MEKKDGPLRVIMVDDHPVVRQGLMTMLNEDPDMEVVAEASDAEEALEKIGQLHPDVVLTDLRMPGMSGIELTREVKASWPNISVIVLTMYDSEMYVIEAIRAGAAGFLVKDCSRELLCHTIKAAIGGGTMIRSELLSQAIQGLSRNPRNIPKQQENLPITEQLTARELDVLRLVADGGANREIARELGLAEVTIKKHVQSIIGKLGASDRTHAAITAVRLGLVQ